MVSKPTVKRPRVNRIRTEYIAKSSIPQDIPLKEYAEQCKQAAISSRLQPDTLHPQEYQLLRKHLSTIHVTTYLNIRNGILRLWHRNPLVSVTREEAAGCAKDPRFFDLADVAYDWLSRNGYVNYGCIEAPLTGVELKTRRKQRTVIVIGAGMSGLGCARQLEGLFNQLAENLLPDELVPKVIVVEARSRLGGRVYSHPVHNKQLSTLEKGRRSVADLGAQIITGFENGNPMSTLVQGQLGLPYHALKDGTKLHDIDGKRVDGNRDALVQKLFNDILDKVQTFIQRGPAAKTVEGDKNLIDQGDDPTGDGDGNGPISTSNDDEDSSSVPASSNPSPTSSKPPNLDATIDKPADSDDSSTIFPAAEQALKMGWTLRPGVPKDATVNLQPKALPGGEYSLGKTMDYVLKEYQKLIELTEQDLRLMNWHYANLEYANAVNVDKLSLRHWDQDDGNEFRGHHSILIGGYQQVPRALFLAPKKLDVRFDHEVSRIDYFGEKVKVEFTNGNVLEGDEVVVTLPLGVLKDNKISFEPPLPNWKQDAISRLGFGLLNKVVLVYQEAFWDVDKDMAGSLNDADGDKLSQDSYRSKRGRFYMFWNCVKVSGTPMLVALMTGDAAEETEKQSDEQIVTEVTDVLTKMFPGKNVQRPLESIITRWRSDPYARGSYSYIATGSTGEDYDRLAAPVADKVFFAGEATCGTHPATVHGAYISGLRAASEVATSIFGPIEIPQPLVAPKPKSEPVYYTAPTPSSASKRKAEDSASAKYREMKEARIRRYEEDLNAAIHSKLGERPQKPGRTGANPFLLYQKDKWFICKAKCDAETQKRLNNPEAKATRNEVRAALGLMWREAPEDEKKPYLDETEDNKKANGIAATDYKKRLATWDKEAEKMREEWRRERPSIPSEEEKALEKEAGEEEGDGKRAKVEG
ncbi:hypothetical protein BJ508DRAFT_209259 [Ascobolus immersus RN42]|uniref:SWIRM domain-containing protein n=1 Tax=Ascobolus immersus RN42 TaxID=1160509 RepID=A0A3N4II80_ASCIM|nr:hypothetical protein BJ508DRAFT_209259 [Ascobolus immersus RN42]